MSDIRELKKGVKDEKGITVEELLEKEYLRDLWIERCFMHKGKRRRSKNARTSY